MNVIARKTLVEFWTANPESSEPLKAWFKEAEKALWRGPADIKTKYRSASFLNDNRVVFNISGNKYRLVVKIAYTAKIVYIRFIGTHAEYSKIKAETV